ncbi:MAG: hypothetical protein GX491_12905 [Chloroflexi bacterium]|nr:hypothetical protein [Chloroflexota bacterium]
MFQHDLYLDSPWMNAAGTLGYLPPPRWNLPEPMGAFVTNPISAAQRTPAAERCLLAYPGGVLIHSGLPNPGFRRVLRKYSSRWAQASLPIWVHLIGSNPDEINRMVRGLEGLEGVMAVELGLPPELRGEEALALVEAAYGELPLIVHLPLSSMTEPWLSELPGLGVSAVSIGAPRGMLANESGRLVSGRLFGPSILPLALAAVRAGRQFGLPVIAGAGIYRREDAQALLDAGAFAVQLDTVLWRGWME